MTETGEPAQGAQQVAQPAQRAQRRSSALWTHKDGVVFGIGVLAAGVMAVVGLVDIPPFWMFMLCFVIAAVVALITRTVSTRTLRQKVNALWLALGCSLLIPLGSVAYQQWFDDANKDEIFRLIATGPDTGVWRPAIGPGESLDRFAYSPIPGGREVHVRCYVDLPGQNRWYDVISPSDGWLPDDAIVPVPHLPTPEIPECSD
ncbi:hypothetical protein [Nonomuraea harbinensis]|uniref:DUF4190 domain-containing protein n=1 Tax=Nonomuraea harbinensis TaxID=1286938 RepID=A0ABW1BKP7_9ACTN|nr:hypothetical protein [Nonomuraea harbinensis]